jgi:hypothetical protein
VLSHQHPSKPAPSRLQQVLGKHAHGARHAILHGAADHMHIHLLHCCCLLAEKSLQALSFSQHNCHNPVPYTQPSKPYNTTQPLNTTLDSTQTWWMMPLPGFQKPTPYLAPAVDRKLYTSLLTSLACVRSASAPNELFLLVLKVWCIVRAVCWCVLHNEHSRQESHTQETRSCVVRREGQTRAVCVHLHNSPNTCAVCLIATTCRTKLCTKPSPTQSDSKADSASPAVRLASQLPGTSSGLRVTSQG